MARDPGAPRRLHPASLPLDLGRRIASFGLIAIGAVFFAARTEELWFLFLLLPTLFNAILRYVSFRYELAGDRLVIREGVLVRQVRQVPYARIQNIDTSQGPIHRLLGVVDVRVETAAGAEPEAVFQVISTAELAELRAAVFAAREKTPGAAEQAPADFFRMRPGDIVVFGLLSQKGLLLLGAAWVLMREFFSPERFEELVKQGVERLSFAPATVGTLAWIVIGLGFVLFLQLGTLGWALVTLYGFRIERRAETLHSTCGLFTKKSASLPRGRIQALHVRAGLFQRFFGRVSIKAVSAGGVGPKEAQITRQWLVPACRREELPRILAEVQPEADFDAVDWRPVHPRAMRRVMVRAAFWLALPATFVAFQLRELNGAPLAIALPVALLVAVALAVVLARLRVQALAWSTTERAIFVRDGILARTRSCVRYEKIQAVRVLQTPFDRRVRMARLSIDTAGAGVGAPGFVIPYLAVRDAVGLMRRLQREATARAFRW